MGLDAWAELVTDCTMVRSWDAEAGVVYELVDDEGRELVAVQVGGVGCVIRAA